MNTFISRSFRVRFPDADVQARRVKAYTLLPKRSLDYGYEDGRFFSSAAHFEAILNLHYFPVVFPHRTILRTIKGGACNCHRHADVLQL
jgi:hypothetical protein